MLIVIAMFLGSSGHPFGQDLHQIRTAYFSLDEKDCAWLDFVESVENEQSAVALAYKGSALAASAQCVYGPFKKLKQFNRGRENLEKAVALKPDNVEIRFLRYQVKMESPRILNYKDIREDEEKIIAEILKEDSKLDPFLLNKMRGYLLNRGDLSYLEKEEINSLVEKE